MDEQRMGEIALAILRGYVRSEPVRLGNDAMRKLGNVAKRISVSLDDLKLFVKTLIGEALEETLGS